MPRDDSFMFVVYLAARFLESLVGERGATNAFEVG
eukprot:CAMPEP_0185588478 /NCGR_PEP_ID=MMETSP0434-20130131/53222_1 /TAXON_ID=626734 ORGANISM="Favella taraikaensis, Strain Fe Narragansett Bay" /NCGR_SAMPLE_ID=MMETSP0434 /ASSEMBLY_ACC=CAM_ASM_000379 /LENGTH=34 /DNA_ID= /DNA_START= /DNA_END= /DNA_ORIENTATION=